MVKKRPKKRKTLPPRQLLEMVALYKSGTRSYRDLGEQYGINHASVINAVRAYEKHAAAVLNVNGDDVKGTQSDASLTPHSEVKMPNKTIYEDDFHSSTPNAVIKPDYFAGKSRKGLVMRLKRSCKKPDKKDKDYTSDDIRKMVRPFSPEMIARTLEIALDKHDNRNSITALRMLFEIIVPKAVEPVIIRQDTEAIERLTKRLTSAANDDPVKAARQADQGTKQLVAARKLLRAN